MSHRTSKLIGWTLIATIAAVCVAMDYFRVQFLYFNWLVIFAIAASAVMVLALRFLYLQTNTSTQEPKKPDN